MRRLTVALSVMLSCCLNTVAASEIQLPKQQLKPFELTAQGVQLDDQLPVYQYEKKLLFPLQGLSSKLGIDIQVDPHSLIASGWIKGENANLMLDLNKDQARRGFTQIPILPELVWGRDNVDIYLEAGFIQQLLPIQITANNLKQRISVSSTVPLPAVQQAITLNQVTNEPGESEEISVTPFDPEHPHDYQAMTPPLFYLQGDAAIAGDDFLTQDYNLNLLSTGDLGFHSYEFGYQRTQGEDTQYRLQISKDLGDLDGRLPVSVGGYQLGDVEYYGDDLNHGYLSGQGVVFGNAADINNNRFGRTTIEGNAPEGWSIHLYRNHALVRIDIADGDNRYVFSGIPVLEGSNLFEIRMFGPNGEYMVRRKTVQSGGQRLGQGQWSYSGFYIDQTADLFNKKSQQEIDELNIHRSFNGHLEYGLTDQITVGATYSQQSIDEWGRTTNRNYFGGNVVANFLKSTWNMEASTQQDGGTAYTFGWQKRLGTDHSARVVYYNFKDFDSDLSKDLARIGADSNLRAELEGSFNAQHPFQYKIGASYRQGDDSSYLIDSRVSTQLGNMAITHFLAYDSHLTHFDRSTSGRLLIDTPMLDWNLTSALDYESGSGITGFDTVFRWRPWRGINNQSVVYFDDPIDDKSRYGYEHRISMTWDWFTAGLSGQIDSRGDWQVSATSVIALNYEDSRVRGEDYRPQVADIKVNVFIDNNNNGRFDSSDQPLQGLHLLSSPSLPHSASNDIGEIRLSQVKSNQLYTIAPITENLPDNLVLRDGPIEVMPMTGKMVTVDLPLVALTDIKGQVLKDHDDMPLAGIEISLKDLHQQPLANLTTGSRGEYEFSNIKPGYYLLQMRPDQLDDYGQLQEEPLFPIALSGRKLDHQQRDLRIKYVEQASQINVAQGNVEETLPTPKQADKVPELGQGIMRMDSEDYTIQIAAQRKAFNLNKLRENYPHQSLEQVTVIRDDQPMYLLIAGQYPNERSAQYGLRDIPKEFANNLPLVKPVTGLQYQHNVYLKWAKRNSAEPQQIDATDWLGQQPAANFTWQLMAAKQRASALTLAKELNLGDNVHIRHQNGWYQLFWGSFGTRAEAQAALAALNNAPQNPWLRSIASLR